MHRLLQSDLKLYLNVYNIMRITSLYVKHNILYLLRSIKKQYFERDDNIFYNSFAVDIIIIRTYDVPDGYGAIHFTTSFSQNHTIL